VEDASSRNGTFHGGSRIQFLDIDGATTIKLGHPTEGPEIVLTPADADAETRVATRVAPLARPIGSNSGSGSEKAVTDPRLDDLIEALNDSDRGHSSPRCPDAVRRHRRQRLLNCPQR
jgi:hypothetical protein